MFNLFAETFHWILPNELAKDHFPAEIIHYLDDFLIILPSDQNPETYCSKFARICSLVGLSIKQAKSEEGMVVSFGGIELDTKNMAIRLPISKLAKARMIVESAVSLTSVSLLDLQRITGYLNFVTVVVTLGRAFLRRLYNRELYFPFKEGRGRQSRLRISKQAQLDLKWWNSLLALATERSMEKIKRENIYLWSDASGTKGLEAYFTTVGRTRP